MTNPAQISLPQTDGSNRYIIIEPMLQKNDGILSNTGVYKLYKDAAGEESTLFTEPLEMDALNNDLDDNNNPDYLGAITLANLQDAGQQNWTYQGDLLTIAEQHQVADFILKA